MKGVHLTPLSPVQKLVGAVMSIAEWTVGILTKEGLQVLSDLDPRVRRVAAQVLAFMRWRNNTTQDSSEGHPLQCRG